MRRLCTSSGLRHSCTEGVESPCCFHRVIPTKPIIRIELEQQMYADSNIVYEHSADSPDRVSALHALLENAPPLPDRMMSWHRALEKLLKGTRDGSKLLQAIEIGTKLNGRTAHSNVRTGNVEGSHAKCGNVHHQRRE